MNQSLYMRFCLESLVLFFDLFLDILIALTMHPEIDFYLLFNITLEN
jgi:hypothetical protein